MSRPLPLPHRKPQPASQGAAMTAPDVAEIARGLTKAQRECVLSDRLPRFTTIYWQGSPGALHALKRKGLTSGPFADQPTPLGLAVRTYLQENPDA